MLLFCRSTEWRQKNSLELFYNRDWKLADVCPEWCWYNRDPKIIEAKHAQKQDFNLFEARDKVRNEYMKEKYYEFWNCKNPKTTDKLFWKDFVHK